MLTRFKITSVVTATAKTTVLYAPDEDTAREIVAMLGEIGCVAGYVDTTAAKAASRVPGLPFGRMLTMMRLQRTADGSIWVEGDNGTAQKFGPGERPALTRYMVEDMWYPIMHLDAETIDIVADKAVA